LDRGPWGGVGGPRRGAPAGAHGAANERAETPVAAHMAPNACDQS